MHTMKAKVALVSGLTLLLSNAFGANVLVNPGFESSALEPWFNSNDYCLGCIWAVTSADANSGTYSASVVGNWLLEQDFAPIATSSITEASLWLKQSDFAVAAVSFLYSDASSFDFLVVATGTWTKFNMTSYLDAGKSLAAPDWRQ